MTKHVTAATASVVLKAGKITVTVSPVKAVVTADALAETDAEANAPMAHKLKFAPNATAHAVTKAAAKAGLKAAKSRVKTKRGRHAVSAPIVANAQSALQATVLPVKVDAMRVVSNNAVKAKMKVAAMHRLS
jgi:hypothetical protein